VKKDVIQIATGHPFSGSTISAFLRKAYI